MNYRITHNTGYRYSVPASLSQNELFLSPRSTPTQEIIEHKLNITPKPQHIHTREDYFGNQVALFMVQQPHNELFITATSKIKTTCPSLPEPSLTLPWEATVERLQRRAFPMDLEACQFTFDSPLISILPEASAYARISFAPQRPVLEGAIDLVRRIYTEFTYDKNASTVESTVEQALQNRRGVCQDFAHLAIAGLRGLGLAARYVSGYLETMPPPGKPRLIGGDASHAWFSIFIPDIGWVDLDPTNNIPANDTYITIAWGRDYGDVAPVKGVVFGGGMHELSVMVDVAAYNEEEAGMV